MLDRVFIKLSSLLLVLLMAVSVSAMAQTAIHDSAKKNQESKPVSTKKKRATRKKERQHAKHESKYASSARTVSGKPRKASINYPKSIFYERFRVGIVVSLYLDELVRGSSVTFRGKTPEKAADGLAFYQGVRLAADSLDKAGASIDIDIYDAGSFLQSPDMLITKRRFDSTDLIIGAVEQHDIPILSDYAQKRKINFVSALSNYDGWVKDNQYFTMLQPTIKSHCEYIIDDLSEKYTNRDVALFYRTSDLADDNAALYILNDLYSEVRFKKLLCNNLPDRVALASVLDTNKPNVIVVSVLDATYADSILNVLSESFPGNHFEVYGMPTWHSIAKLKRANKYKNLTINVTYPFNFDAADSTLRGRVKATYKLPFGGTPSEMVFRGYEAMLWYGTLLEHYGTQFNNNYGDVKAPFTRFKIKPRWDRNGRLLYFENKNIYMSAYQSGVSQTK